MSRELIVYGRRFACWDQERAVAYLDRNQVAYRFVDITSDPTAAARLEKWVGHLSVPTLLVAGPDGERPVADPLPLDPDRSIRGQDRGSMISEPSDPQLESFLRTNGLI